MFQQIVFTEITLSCLLFEKIKLSVSLDQPLKSEE